MHFFVAFFDWAKADMGHQHPSICVRIFFKCNRLPAKGGGFFMTDPCLGKVCIDYYKGNVDFC
jgi:hypothetical protein